MMDIETLVPLMASFRIASSIFSRNISRQQTAYVTVVLATEMTGTALAAANHISSNVPSVNNDECTHSRAERPVCRGGGGCLNRPRGGDRAYNSGPDAAPRLVTVARVPSGGAGE